MASFDDLDAPQFSNFEDYDQEEAELYFEIDHESERLKDAETQGESEPLENSVEENFYSPMNTNSVSSDKQSLTRNLLELRSRKIRRSLSSGDIKVPTESLSNMRLNGGKSENKVENNNFKYGTLRKEKTGSQSKLRWCSQESLNRLAAPKRIHSSFGNLAHASEEYVSVAEAVRKFHEKTPSRYHSLNKNNPAPKNAIPAKLKATIPMSPRLLTKKRAKVTETVLSTEQRQQMEFEKEQKFKIKAHPMNKKIFQPMKAIHVEKKPPTVPEPFKLSKVDSKKTTISPKKDEYQFHAKPIPKSVLEAPKLPKKQDIKVTIPVTPSFIKKLPKASPAQKEPEKAPNHPLRNTKPVPFSFEKRDERLMKKKEELIKKVIEEENKAREFHARPIPKPVASIISKQKQKSLSGSSSSLNQGDKSEHEEHFKARPPTVLYQKPFEPKKIEHFTEIQPFNFESEMRAKEREKFERRKREQEELAASLLKKDEEERLQREEEERRRIREQTKFKAHPVRNFKGVLIKPSGKVTEPISPVFLSGKNRRNNKENEMLN